MRWCEIFESLKTMKILRFVQIFPYNSKTTRLTENRIINKMKEHKIARRITYLKVEIGSAV